MNNLWKISSLFYRSGAINWIKKIARLLEIFQFIIYSNAVSCKAQIGDNTKFHHHGLGCVVHDNAIIGKQCTIFQNVTIGSKWPDGHCEGKAPTIGNNVLIGAGAVLIGNITVGDRAIIGANAVVTIDVPMGSMAVGIPAIIKRK